MKGGDISTVKHQKARKEGGLTGWNDYRILIIYYEHHKEGTNRPNKGKEKIKEEEESDDGFRLFSHWVCFVAIFSF